MLWMLFFFPSHGKLMLAACCALLSPPIWEILSQEAPSQKNEDKSGQYDVLFRKVSGNGDTNKSCTIMS